MRTALVGVVLAALVIYHANGRPHPEADCVPAPFAAWALVRHGNLDLRSYSALRPYFGGPIRQTPDGSLVSRYPFGSVFAMVPFVAPLAVFREEPLPLNKMDILGKFAAACYVAAAVGLFLLICSNLAPAARWPATILFGLGTCLCSVASQAIWMHGPATFWVCLALWLLLRPGSQTFLGCCLAGLALGTAVVTRPTTAFLALATGVALLSRRQWRQAFGLALGGAVPVLVLCAVNWLQFGNPVLGGYQGEYGNEPPPFWLAFFGLLLAPSRGVLVYSPALLMVPLGAVAIWRRTFACEDQSRAILLAWLAAAALTLLSYSRYWDWRGGWCYGPRYFCELTPVLCLTFAIAYSRFALRWQRSLGAGLVALSAAVHLVGLFGYSGSEAWQRRHESSDHWRCLFALKDTQIEAHARATLRSLLGPKGDRH